MNRSPINTACSAIRLELNRQWKSKKTFQKVHGSPQSSFDANAKKGTRSHLSRKSPAASSTQLSPPKISRMAPQQSSKSPPQSPPAPPLPLLPRVPDSQTTAQLSAPPSREVNGGGTLSPLRPPPPSGNAPYFRVSSSGYVIPDAPAAQPPTPQSQNFRHKTMSLSGREDARIDTKARVFDFEGSLGGDGGDLLS